VLYAVIRKAHGHGKKIWDGFVMNARRKMNLENYVCEGQMELTDYLKSLEAERIEKLGKCLECIYLIDDKCKRDKCHFVAAAEGWKPMWYIGPKVYGTLPECKTWKNAEALREKADGSVYVSECVVKDKTWKFPKVVGFYDNTIAWRFVPEEANQTEEKKKRFDKEGMS
jgi:hypothetical protein